MSNGLPDKGVLYAASGAPKYTERAVVSARSLKRVSPNLHITLITDKPNDQPVFDQVIIHPSSGDGFEDKIRYICQTPYQKTLFLDADTYVMQDVTEVFSLLDHFDIGMTHGLQWRNLPKNAPPSARQQIPPGLMNPPFQHLNSGVIIFKRSDKLEEVFDNWLKRFQKNPWMTDQPALNESLYESNLRLVTLPEQYNTRIFISGRLMISPIILHADATPEHFEKIVAFLDSFLSKPNQGYVFLGLSLFGFRNNVPVWLGSFSEFALRHPTLARVRHTLALDRSFLGRFLKQSLQKLQPDYD